MTDAIHDPYAVVRRHGRPAVEHVGSVQDMAGRALHVSVNGGTVTVGEHVLGVAQLETFAALFVRACWLAAQE